MHTEMNHVGNEHKKKGENKKPHCAFIKWAQAEAAQGVSTFFLHELNGTDVSENPLAAGEMTDDVTLLGANSQEAKSFKSALNKFLEKKNLPSGSHPRQSMTITFFYSKSVEKCVGNVNRKTGLVDFCGKLSIGIFHNWQNNDIINEKIHFLFRRLSRHPRTPCRIKFF